MNKALFIGLGGSAPAWYRCGLPSIYIEDSDWVGVRNEDISRPVAGSVNEYNPYNYQIIVVQQARGKEWINTIKEWQSKGIKVIYECDDFLHGIWKIEGHRFQKAFHKKRRKEFELCMKQCDAMICSTEFLSDQYKKYNPRQYVCNNAIDTERYNIEIPKREDIIIGWGGGTGHHLSVGPWLQVVAELMAIHENLRFISLGTRYGDPINELYPGRSTSAPWVSIENYPYALTNMDIAIAPAHVSKYYKSKSDLRWLEASAVGIPTVASPIIYSDIKHGETGMLAEDSESAYHHLDDLLFNDDLRIDIGKKAKEYVREYRDIRTGVNDWILTLEDVMHN